MGAKHAALALRQVAGTQGNINKALSRCSISRRGVVYVMCFAIGAYIFGLIAVHVMNVALFTIMFIFQLGLGPVIFVFHTMCDKYVRQLCGT